jgi:hypothetical protein
MCDKFGTSGPASLAWELVPFSFVLDWFVDLRGVFNLLDNALTGNRKKVVDVSFSQKFDLTLREIFHPASPYASGQDGTTTATHRVRYYHREIPTVSLIGLSGRFGKKQALLTLSLLHQLVPNLLKRILRR